MGGRPTGMRDVARQKGRVSGRLREVWESLRLAPGSRTDQARSGPEPSHSSSGTGLGATGEADAIAVQVS